MIAYIINRKVDSRRWAFVEQNVEKSDTLSISRIDAVDGLAKDFSAEKFSTSTCKPILATPGTSQKCANAACFLSHVKAWQAVLDSDKEYGLILEDDIVLEGSFADLEKDLKTLPEFDLVYVNRAMISRRTLFQPERAEELFISVDENYKYIRTHFEVESRHIMLKSGGKLEAPGGYGYVLSRKGAAKLLKQFEIDNQPIELDNYINFNGLSQDTIKSVTHKGAASFMVRTLRPRISALQSYIYNRSLVRHKASAVGGSVRKIRLKPESVEIVKQSLVTPDFVIKAIRPNVLRENITNFTIFGERCSGTNFVQSLIRQNLKIRVSRIYGWKHAFPNMTSTKANSLAVVVFRHPETWLQSFHRRPWHASNALRNITFSQFIRQEWSAIVNKAEDFGLPDDKDLLNRPLLLDHHPLTGTPFENVLALRNAKNLGFLGLEHRFDSAIFVRHEDVTNNQDRFITYLTKAFELQPTEGQFSPVTTYKNRAEDTVFTGTKYKKISEVDRRYIWENLDTEIENRIGYHNKDT